MTQTQDHDARAKASPVMPTEVLAVADAHSQRMGKLSDAKILPDERDCAIGKMVRAYKALAAENARLVEDYEAKLKQLRIVRP